MGIAHIVAALIGIFVVSLVAPPLLMVMQDYLTPALYPNVTDVRGQAAINNINRMTVLAFVIVIIGLFLYMFATAGRREYDSTRDRPPV